MLTIFHFCLSLLFLFFCFNLAHNYFREDLLFFFLQVFITKLSLLYLQISCYPKKSLNNIPRGIALRLRRICDTDEKFNSRSIEYKNYLIARDYKPSVVNKHFAHVSTLSRQQARQKSTNRKSQVNKNVKTHDEV